MKLNDFFLLDDEKLLKYLLENGADVYSQNHAGVSVRQLAEHNRKNVIVIRKTFGLRIRI